MKLILWLEEEKIRLYEKIDRAPLRKFDKAWYEAVGKYAKELGVPADGFTEKAVAVKLNVLSLGLGGPYSTGPIFETYIGSEVEANHMRYGDVHSIFIMP